MRSRIAAALLVLVAAAAPARAGVDVTLDAGTLNDLISKMAPETVPVTLGGGRSINLRLDELKIVGFDPAAGERGEVLTSLRLKVPELGLDVPVSPRLSLQFRDGKGGKKVAYLRFEEVKLLLPVTGSIDLAPLLPPLPITSDTSWVVAAQRGNVRVEPKLVDATLGAKNLRLAFDLDVRPE